MKYSLEILANTHEIIQQKMLVNTRINGRLGWNSMSFSSLIFYSIYNLRSSLPWQDADETTAKNNYWNIHQKWHWNRYYWVKYRGESNIILSVISYILSEVLIGCGKLSEFDLQKTHGN